MNPLTITTGDVTWVCVGWSRQATVGQLWAVTPIAPADIVVVDPVGKGEIGLALSPAHLVLERRARPCWRLGIAASHLGSPPDHKTLENWPREKV